MKKLKKYFELKGQETVAEEKAPEVVDQDKEEKKPMSLKKKIAIGVGAAAALVLGVAGVMSASKHSDDGDYEEDDYFEFDPATETPPANDPAPEASTEA